MRKRLARAPTVHGAEILKDAYDPKLTLKQNYAKLGLIPSLDVRPDTGGTERPSTSTSAKVSSDGSAPVRKGMARVIRDESGKVVDIIEPEEEEESSPWGKQMSSIVDSEDVETYMPSEGGKKTTVVQELEIMAAKAEPVQRHTSALESQWLRDLVAKYGEDTERMSRDRGLNVWQKTEGEIRRAIKKAGGFEAFK